MGLEVMGSGALTRVPTQLSPEALARITTLEAELATLKQEVGLVKDTITSGYYALSGGTPIKDNTDLNTITTIGNYYCDFNDTAVSLINSPAKTAFTMKVEKSTGTAYPSQTLKTYEYGNIYYRILSKHGWTAWGKITA